ncbi:MAG: hypothetical protein WBF71_12385 [Microthrixaceae bacterium]
MAIGDSFSSLVHNRANPVTSDVQRVVFGAGSDIGEPGSSAIIKTIRADGPQIVPHWPAGADSSHWNFWSREALAYENHVPDAFRVGGLRGPRLLDRVELSDGSVQLWLEDVVGRSGHELDLADHARISRRLGKAQGSIRPRVDGSSPVEIEAERAARAEAQAQVPAETPTPVPVQTQWLDLPFLSRGWMRSYALSRPAGPGIRDDPQAWEHPVVVAGFGEARHRLRARFGELYRDAPRWFELMESLPRTLCHLDFWPNNAIAVVGTDEPDDVLIDWAFVGDGAVGEDPGNWVPDTLFDHFMEPERFAELDAAVWQAYSAGLIEAGWPWPIEFARLGMCASAIKFLWLPGLMVSTADHKGPTGYGGQPSYPLVEVFRRRALVFERLLGWLDEASDLARSLKLPF